MKIPPGTADFITRMFSDLQVWGERMSGRRSCGLRVDSGDSRQSARERPVLASGRQSDRRPNAKPRTLPASPAVPLRAAGRLWCGGLLQRSAESPTRPPNGQAGRPSLRLSSSLVAPTPPRTTDGLVSATATECTAHTETPPWSPSLPALGHRPLKRGMDAPDA